MAQYLLPCSCGKQVRVVAAQAGGQATCSCGQTLAVPTLRGLRALEEAPPDKAELKRAAGRRWGPLQGALFSIGLLVTVIALGVVGYTFWKYLQATPYARDFSPEFNQFEGQVIDQLEPADALHEFLEMRDKGLGEPVAPPWVQVQHLVAEQQAFMIAAGIAAALGVLAIVAALVMRPAAR